MQTTQDMKSRGDRINANRAAPESNIATTKLNNVRKHGMDIERSDGTGHNRDYDKEASKPTLQGLPFEIQSQILDLALPHPCNLTDLLTLSDQCWRLSCVMYSVVTQRIRRCEQEIRSLQARRIALDDELKERCKCARKAHFECAMAIMSERSDNYKRRVEIEECIRSMKYWMTIRVKTCLIVNGRLKVKKSRKRKVKVKERVNSSARRFMASLKRGGRKLAPRPCDN